MIWDVINAILSIVSGVLFCVFGALEIGIPMFVICMYACRCINERLKK